MPVPSRQTLLIELHDMSDEAFDLFLPALRNTILNYSDSHGLHLTSRLGLIRLALALNIYVNTDDYVDMDLLKQHNPTLFS